MKWAIASSISVCTDELWSTRETGFPDREDGRVKEDCEGGAMRSALVKEINIKIANIHLLNLKVKKVKLSDCYNYIRLNFWS